MEPARLLRLLELPGSSCVGSLVGRVACNMILHAWPIKKRAVDEKMDKLTLKLWIGRAHLRV